MSLFDEYADELPDDRIFHEADAIDGFPRETPVEPVNQHAVRSALTSVRIQLARGVQPPVLHLVARSGMGKTHLAQRVFATEQTDADITPIWLHRPTDESTWSCIGRFGRKLSHSSHIPHSESHFTGVSEEKLRSRIQETLLAQSSPVAVLIDEFTQDSGVDAVFDCLNTTIAAAEEPAIGVVALSRADQEARLTAAFDRPGVLKVELGSYSVEEIRRILRQKADAAFVEDAVSDEILERIATRVRERDLSPRAGEFILKNAATAASEMGAATIEERHVQEGLAEFESN